MDLTTTCPTCGHSENASLETCSFCGVDLGRYSESRPDTEAVDTTAGDQSVSNLQSVGIAEKLIVQSPPVDKPDSVDEAVAHVLSADPVLDLVEEIDSVKVLTPAENDPKEADPENNPPAHSLPEQRPAEDVNTEAIILPDSVQLQADNTADGVGQSADQTPPEDADGETAEDLKKQELKKHRAALAKAEAVKKRKLALARAAALKNKKMALKQTLVTTANIRILKLLKPYLGNTIGINFDNSAVIAAAELTAINSEYLSVWVKHSKLRYHFPLKTILSVIESADGKGVPTGAEDEVFNAVVKIYPLVLF